MFCEADYRLNILTNEDAAQVVLYISHTCLSDEAQNVYRAAHLPVNILCFIRQTGV